MVYILPVVLHMTVVPENFGAINGTYIARKSFPLIVLLDIVYFFSCRPSLQISWSVYIYDVMRNKWKYCLPISAAMYATSSFSSGLFPLARMFKKFIILTSVCFAGLFQPMSLVSNVFSYWSSRSFFNLLYNVRGIPNLSLNFFLA